jgi:hypothetical protein
MVEEECDTVCHLSENVAQIIFNLPIYAGFISGYISLQTILYQFHFCE